MLKKCCVTHIFVSLIPLTVALHPGACVPLAALVVVIHHGDDAAEGTPGADLGHARRQQLVHLQDPLDPLHRRAPHHAGFPSGRGNGMNYTLLSVLLHGHVVTN